VKKRNVEHFQGHIHETSRLRFPLKPKDSLYLKVDVQQIIFNINIFFLKCNEMKHVTMPEFLMPDDFKAYMKVKIDNQHFNKYNNPL
jgi:hypothetical protein